MSSFTLLTPLIAVYDLVAMDRCRSKEAMTTRCSDAVAIATSTDGKDETLTTIDITQCATASNVLIES